MIELELPFVTPSNNELLRKYRHWAVKRRLKTYYMDEIMTYILEHDLKDIQAEGKRECEIMSYRKRLLDKDNLYGGAKPLVDVLVKFGLLIDDNPDMCVLSVDQEKSRAPRTEITLKDIKEE